MFLPGASNAINFIVQNIVCITYQKTQKSYPEEPMILKKEKKNHRTTKKNTYVRYLYV